MGIGFTLLLVLHILICLFIILIVTVQNDKGGGLAGAFGGMGGGAAFTGSSAVTILTRVTQWSGAVSFVVLIMLNAMSLRAHRAAQTASELKAASKGLSAVLPAMPSGSNSIPGLGGNATESDAGHAAGGQASPANAPSIPGLGNHTDSKAQDAGQ